MEPIQQYLKERDEQLEKNWGSQNKRWALENAVYNFTEHLVRTNYTKNFTWQGIPILQYPSDLMVMQELIWTVKPHFIIETGIAFGGMSVFYNSMMNLLWGCRHSDVISIDKEIRPHARRAICDYMAIEGDSISQDTFNQVVETLKRRSLYYPWDREIRSCRYSIISLDSNHTHDHVLAELRLYSTLSSVGSYIVVFDTAIDIFGHLDKNQDRPWGDNNNPASAVRAFLKENDSFVVDRDIERRALITAAPGGWIRRVK